MLIVGGDQAQIGECAVKRLVHLLAEAEQELEDAFWWYERQRNGLGLDFLLAFDAVVESLRRLPEGHELVARRTRKALLRRFPYLVLYAVEAERVLITAVFHGRRDPQRWSDRVREGVFAVRGAFQHDIRLQRSVRCAATAAPERWARHTAASARRIGLHGRADRHQGAVLAGRLAAGATAVRTTQTGRPRVAACAEPSTTRHTAL